MSMISEQIKTLEVLRDELFNNNMKVSSFVVIDAIRTIKDLASKVHANNMHDEWIPIEHGLPEREGSYLVCTIKGGVMVTHFYPEHRRFSSTRINGLITAWMPLPEPYREE